MPTNKLWLEHTERAAWDTIHALREKLSKAESRLQALAPGVGVEELFDRLESAKVKYAPEAVSYVAVVAELVAHIERLQAELSSNQVQQSVINVAVPLPRPPLDSDDLAERPRDPYDDDVDTLARFTRVLCRRAERSQPRGAGNIEVLLQQAEDRLDEMNEADGVVLRDAAVELALLAASIYSLSRGAD